MKAKKKQSRSDNCAELARSGAGLSYTRVVPIFAGNVLLVFQLFLVSIAFLSHTPAYAQQAEGAKASGTFFLTGTVMDPSHAVVPNAEITLIQPKGSVVARLRTDSQGRFRAAIPGPGNYKIEVSSPDFETLSRSVEVTGNATVPLTLSLEIRKATSSVSVSASARDAEYEVQESSTTSKINLPILLTPQSVEVVPRAVLQDQKVLTLDAATRNVSGVSTDFGFNGSSEPLLILRGFSSVSMTAMGAMSGIEVVTH